MQVLGCTINYHDCIYIVLLFYCFHLVAKGFNEFLITVIYTCGFGSNKGVKLSDIIIRYIDVNI